MHKPQPLKDLILMLLEEGLPLLVLTLVHGLILGMVLSPLYQELQSQPMVWDYSLHSVSVMVLSAGCLCLLGLWMFFIHQLYWKPYVSPPLTPVTKSNLPKQESSSSVSHNTPQSQPTNMVGSGSRGTQNSKNLMQQKLNQTSNKSQKKLLS